MLDCVKKFAASNAPDYMDGLAACGMFIIAARDRSCGGWQRAAAATAVASCYIILKNSLVYKPLSSLCHRAIAQIPTERLLKKIGFEL